MLNEMKYVYEVYKEKSFSKAAKKLFISQPALSNMVRKAEKEMGAPIFDRSTIPLTVTKEGAYYIRTVEKILFLERNLERYFQDIAGLQGGTLALGGASYFCSFVYPDLIARFQTKYPQVTIDLTEGNTRELKAGLENESLDLVLETAMEKDDTSIKRYLFRKENLILAVPESFPVNRKLQPYRLSRQEILSKSFLKPEVEAVPLKEFKDVPFITMKQGNDMYKRGAKMCRNGGFTMKTVMMVDQVLTSLNIVSNGVGAMFVRSDIVQWRPEDPRLVYYKLDDPLSEREITFSVKRGRYVTAAMREFMRLAGIRSDDPDTDPAAGRQKE